EIDAGLAPPRLFRLVRRAQSRPAAIQPIRLVRLIGLSGFVLFLKMLAPAGYGFVDIFLRDDIFFDELLRIELKRRWMGTHLLVHQGLREARLVAFVMAEAAVTP